MNRFSVTTVIIIIVWAMTAQAKETHENQNTLRQVSTLNALLAGEYDGRASFHKVARYGDFGLGTFHALDGELIALDGKFYQIPADGQARPVSPRTTTPFAAMTFFRADQTFLMEEPGTCEELRKTIFQHLPSEELLYAIKVTGTFSQLQTRSVHAQEKPYVSLEEALKEQVVFDFAYVDATLVGFWLPEVLSEVNAAGFHFHGLTADRKAGGHVLDCEVLNATVEIDHTDKLKVKFGTIKRPVKGEKRKGTGRHRHSEHAPMVPW